MPSTVSDLRRASQGSALRKTSGIRIDRHAHGAASRLLQPIKTPASTLPASELSFSQTNSFSKENAALPERVRCSGVDE
jgi:hypothetical protein